MMPDSPTPIKEAYYQLDSVTGHAWDEMKHWLRTYTARLRAEGRDDNARRAAMHRVNPHFVLRNYIAQEAIDAAEQGDTAILEELLTVMKQPYDVPDSAKRWVKKRPEWARIAGLQHAFL